MADAQTVRIAIVIPQVGEAIAEATLVEWKVREGDVVAKGDILFVVDTEKAEVDIEAFADGTIDEILVPAQTAVTPGQRIGIMAVDGSKVPLGAEVVDMATPIAQPPVVAEQTSSTADTREPDGTSASPRARKRADELGIDIAEVAAAHGTPVTVEDVETFASQRPALGFDSLALSRTQKAVATATTASKQSVPHFYLDSVADMSAVLQHRQKCQTRPTLTAYVIAACVRALETHPQWNVSYDEDGLKAREQISVGVAVDTEAGLLVPLLADLGGTDVETIGERLSAAVDRARRQSLTVSDQGERSLVVSNLGMHGVERFHAIINQPDPFILAVGRTAEAVVVVSGQIAIRPQAVLSVSADHRVTDGVMAARFLSTVIGELEQVPAAQ